MEQNLKEQKDKVNQDKAANIDPKGEEPNNEMCC